MKKTPWDNMYTRMKIFSYNRPLKEGKFEAAFAAKVGYLDFFKHTPQDEIYYDNCYNNVVCIAVKNGHFDIVDWFRENNTYCNYWALFCAVTMNDRELIKWLLDRGYSKTFHELMHAAKENDVSMMKYLVSLGYTITNLTLFNATRYASTEVVEYILDTVPDLDAKFHLRKGYISEKIDYLLTLRRKDHSLQT